MRLYHSETFDISFIEAQNLLHLQCQGDVSSDVSSEECKAGFLLAVQNARKNQVKNWLLDFRLVEQITDETLSWIQVQVFPQLMAYLGPANYLALVVSEPLYQAMLNEYGYAGLQTYNSFIILNIFTAPETAVAWLQACTAVSSEPQEPMPSVK
ncbi:hypothetical protein [Botryobacter ruber]|uniref:hypothetical protein n=1 Tax=Botryobacter ruber TaxID=2171629 RepID=UPI000FEC51E2|nr:hypothetical protein [Botryobacter ruber]